MLIDGPNRLTSMLLGVESTAGFVSVASYTVTRSRRCLVVTPTAKAQEVEVVMDLFLQPRPRTLQWPANATVTKVNTE
jgi:hypothetical protein